MPMLGANGRDDGNGSDTATAAGHKFADIGIADGGKDTVTALHRISSGIIKDATSTTIHDVICTCGFRTRRKCRPTHTALPRTKERSADSARIANIYFLPPLASAFAFAILSASARNFFWSSIAVSTMPTRTSSIEPLQNQSTMRCRALGATRPRGSAA